jgi:hypothetical protein
MYKILLPFLFLSGCASVQHSKPQPDNLTSTSHPLMSIAVDCRYGASMVNDLEYIIANPHFVNPVWQNTFATIAGSQTPHQRQASAKKVLWTIRTQCQGF